MQLGLFIAKCCYAASKWANEASHMLMKVAEGATSGLYGLGHKAAANPYPWVDPIIFSVGKFSLRWYSLAYVAGGVVSATFAIAFRKKAGFKVSISSMCDMYSYAAIGAILGGRLGYACIYNAPYYVRHPLEVLYVWNGGMSAHGGLIGVLVAVWAFSKAKKVSFGSAMDLIAIGAPLALMLGRIANFINGELWGRPTTLPIGVVFPLSGGDIPRHPSQLYEAALEGLLLFAISFSLAKFTNILKRERAMICITVGLYSVFRFIVEFFREPDAHLSPIFNGVLSMGQVLCIITFMVMLGLYFIRPSHHAKLEGQPQ